MMALTSRRAGGVWVSLSALEAMGVTTSRDGMEEASDDCGEAGGLITASIPRGFPVATLTGETSGTALEGASDGELGRRGEIGVGESEITATSSSRTVVITF